MIDAVLVVTDIIVIYRKKNELILILISLKCYFSHPETSILIDVPRPLINDLWVFLFQTIDAKCVK